MAINLETRGGDTRYRRLQSWEIDGHEVALLEYEGTRSDGSAYSGKELYCECAFKDGSRSFYECKAKKRVRSRLRKQAKARLGGHWRTIGPKKAILDIFRRVNSGEHLGQGSMGCIHAREVADFLDISERAIVEYCDKLCAEEKLGLNGTMLIPYKPRFRFPREIEGLFRFMIEYPLGWPNGNAGDYFLWKLEEAIGAVEEGTRFRSGKDAFGENYPHILPEHLALFGVEWVSAAADRAEKDEDLLCGFRALDLAKTADELELLAKRYRRLNEKMKEKNQKE